MRIARRTFLASAAAMLAAPAVLRLARADAPQAVLKLHHFMSSVSSAHDKFLAPWARQVEAQSGGRIRIDLFPSMQLGGAPADLFDQARDGCMKAAKEIGGIQCLFIGPADATEQEQVQVVQDLITKHVDGIGVSAANAPAIANSWPGRRKLIFLSSPGTAICCRPTRDFAPLTSARSTKRSAKRSPNRRWR